MSTTRAPAAVRWTIYVLVAALFAVACGFLSYWQFSRNEERASQLALIEANYDAPPVALDDVLPNNDDLPAHAQWHPVLLRGTYLSDQQLVVRNRPHGGTSAFEVLVPFRTESGRILLINRGWVPPTEQSTPSAIPAAPQGTVEVVVRIREGESLPASGRTDAPEGQVPTIHLPLIAQHLALGDAFVTGAYGTLVSEEPAPAERPQALEDPSADPGPHLSYAIQWILFAAMGFFFIGYVIRTERDHRRDTDEEDTPHAPRARRTRDRDMVDEDEILDHLPR